MFPQKLPLCLQGWSPPRNTLFLGPNPLIIPNGMSIGSVVFVWIPNAMLYNALSMRKKIPKIAPSPFDFVTMPEKDRATAIDNMQKIGKDRGCGSGDILADKQTDTHTDMLITILCNRFVGEVIIIIITSDFGDWRISTHADPTSTRRAISRTALYLAWRLRCGLRAGRFVRFWASMGAKFTKMGDSVPWTVGRWWIDVQNLTPLALSSAETSVTVQAHTKKQTVNNISSPHLADRHVWIIIIITIGQHARAVGVLLSNFAAHSLDGVSEWCSVGRWPLVLTRDNWRCMPKATTTQTSLCSRKQWDATYSYQSMSTDAGIAIERTPLQ